MKFLFNLFLLYPFLVFSQSEVKIEYWDNGKVLSQVHYKDGERDGYKCVYKRQKKGKDVTVFQPSAICQKSFKCKQENQ